MAVVTDWAQRFDRRIGGTGIASRGTCFGSTVGDDAGRLLAVVTVTLVLPGS